MQIENQYHCSLDTVDFGDGFGWSTLCEALGLTSLNRNRPIRLRSRVSFYFVGPGIVVETSNNPSTGEYQNPSMRADQLGYADMIGVTARNQELVDRFLTLVVENAKSISCIDAAGRFFF